MNDANAYPIQVQEELESIRLSGGSKVISDSSYTYILLALGERSTGGYSIQIVDIAEVLEDGQPLLTVKAKELKPAPDAMVIQVITYPTLVYRIPFTPLPIKVEWVRAA